VPESRQEGGKKEGRGVKKEIRHVDAARGIVQITCPDERWYTREVDGRLVFVPSVTWITEHYPKGQGFIRYIATKGLEEAELYKVLRGDKGSRIHAACSALLRGEEVHHGTPFYSELSEDERSLDPEEFAAVMSFVDWYLNGKCPKCNKTGCFEILAFDYTVWNDRYGFAGTVDIKLRLRCNRSVWIVDLKTSKAVYESHRAQVCAYRKTDPDTAKRGGQAILQLGYGANKHQKFKWTTVPNSDWNLFLTARRIWLEQSANIKPHQKDYPLTLRLADRVPAESTHQLVAV
jgi:hypothetical protein